jgi:hypothetical protein
MAGHEDPRADIWVRPPYAVPPPRPALNMPAADPRERVYRDDAYGYDRGGCYSGRSVIRMVDRPYAGCLPREVVKDQLLRQAGTTSTMATCRATSPRFSPASKRPAVRAASTAAPARSSVPSRWARVRSLRLRRPATAALGRPY